jgi:NADPH:quinone reductase
VKAVRVHEFGGPEKLILENVAELNPGAGEILIEIHAAGVNPVDTYIRSGSYARKPQLPYTPGHDGAGVIIKVAEGAGKFKVGDRVYVAGSLTGTYAEQVLCRESQVYPLAKNVPYAQGASLGVPYGTAYRALFQKANALPGETVLIHGASGGVGIATVQLARAARLTVIGTAGTDRGLQLVQEQGAHHALDHEAATAEKIQTITGQGVDIVVEMLANKNLAKDLSMLNPRGRVVVIGNRGTIEINPRDAMARDAAIIGMLLFNATDQELTTIHAALKAGLENGVIRPVIREEMPLADAPRAHETVMSPGSHGKIVLIP